MSNAAFSLCSPFAFTLHALFVKNSKGEEKREGEGLGKNIAIIIAVGQIQERAHESNP